MGEGGFNAIAFVAEQRIREAQDRGEFENLPGRGRPLNLEDDSMVPEDLRMAYKVLRNAGYLPPELAERREITTLVEMLEQCRDEQERVRRMQKLRLVLNRVAASRNRPVALDDNDPYYRQIMERINLVERRQGADTGGTSV